MQFENILSLFCGLSMFLYGMHLMGDALEKRAGKRLKIILSRLASTPLKGFLLGTAVTAIVQSSCATTVMVVGFVNSGLMTLLQSSGVIIGANVGTAITSWITSLTGVTGDAWYITIFKPSTFTPILAVIGVAMLMFGKRDKLKDTAGIMLGFAVLMFGMETMSSAVKPLGENETFTSLLTMFSNPFLGVLVGTLFTAIIQSSSASVGIIQVLATTGAIHYSSILPLLFGFNIGTCVTALLSSTGASSDARRASLFHLTFNLLSAVVMLPVYYGLNALVHFSFAEKIANPFGIAMMHSIIKVICAFIALPFAKQLTVLMKKLVRDKDEEEGSILLDERLFINPSIAINSARGVTVEMAQVVSESFSRAISLMDHFNESGCEKVEKMEKRADEYEDKLGTYLVKLGELNLAADDSHEQSELLHMIGDFERISDHAANIAESSKELNEKHLKFSAQAIGEIAVMTAAVGEALRLATTAFVNNDLESAAQVEPLEQVVDTLQKQIRTRHIDRLSKGLCSIELGFVLTDMLVDFERISDHCSNIAGCVIETQLNSMDLHSYLGEVKSGSDESFNRYYRAFTEAYALPVQAEK